MKQKKTKDVKFTLKDSAVKSNLTLLQTTLMRLGLPEKLELGEALNSVRKAINNRWLMEAEVLCRFILIHRPEQPDAWALRGETALADNDPVSARLYFHEALKSLDELPSAQDLRKQRYIYWEAIADCNNRLNRRDLAEKAFLQMARYDYKRGVSAQTEEIGLLLQKSYQLILQNRLDEAEPILKSILEINTGNAFVWQGLAVLEHKRGNHNAAISAIDKAIEINPEECGFWNNRGVVLKPLGAPKVDERVDAYRRATQINPTFKEAYSNLADTLISARRFDEARQALDSAFSVDPGYVGAKINEANLLKVSGKKKDAITAIDAILEKNRHPEALNIKGALLLETGDPHRAIVVLEESRQLDSRNASVLNNLGNAYLATARPAKAIEAYRSAVILSPGMAEAQANLALALLSQIQHGGPRGEYLALANDHLLKAQALDPHLPQLFVAEGLLKVQHEDDRQGARSAYEKALALQPESVHALAGLSSIAADMGERRRARELLQRAAALAPDDSEVMTNFIFSLNYDPESTPQEIFKAVSHYGNHIENRIGLPYREWNNNKDSKKRLKIGFVSGDFRMHPVAYFSKGLFEHLDRSEVEIFAYHNHLGHDSMTTRIRARVDHWRVISDQSTEAACEIIRADGVDLLVDLSGHTGYHRLDIFAKKPAPLSASWLGFVTSTGIKNVDALLVDPITAPLMTQSHYVERLVYLPCIAAFDFTDDLNATISPPPSLSRGYVTFASFNNLIKMNEGVFDTWAQILFQVPNSRLVLKYRQFNDPIVKQRVEQAFAARGVNPDRVQFSGSIPGRREALEYWKEADIALDPFPYNGATTTLETLFMGVPTVTLLADRFSGRMTAGYLTSLGLNELIAEGTQQYIQLAVDLAKSPERLVQYRSELRTRLLSTPAGNPALFAPQWLSAIKGLWVEFCKKGFIERPWLTLARQEPNQQ